MPTCQVPSICLNVENPSLGRAPTSRLAAPTALRWLSMKLFHSRTQKAVGQGGFHSATLDDGVTVFHYVYDCGSNNVGRLTDATRDLLEECDSLDVLFLSHLDQDHANGCDALLDALAVETVVLPYLSSLERLVLAAEIAAGPAATTSLVTAMAMLSRPAAWFLDRGAERVVFVRGRRPNDPEPVPPGPMTVPPPHDAPMTLAKTSPEHPSDEERTSLGGPGRRAADDVVIMPSSPLLISKAHSPIWELTPYVHPEPFRAPEFRKAVARLLGVRESVPDTDPRWHIRLKAVIADRPRRGVLAKLYNDHIRRDRNLSSMALYSGPIANTNVAAETVGVSFGIRPHYRVRHVTRALVSDQRIGWLGTGDAHLDRDIRRESLERFYGARLASTGTIMLPHHGSRHNVRPSFIISRPGTAWVAAYGTDNTYKHPSQRLMQIADANGQAVHVTERRRSEFVENIELEW